jgi:hypothetical protein
MSHRMSDRWPDQMPERMRDKFLRKCQIVCEYISYIYIMSEYMNMCHGEDHFNIFFLTVNIKRGYNTRTQRTCMNHLMVILAWLCTGSVECNMNGIISRFLMWIMWVNRFFLLIWLAFGETYPYLGKVHHGRTLFSRTLGSWLVRGIIPKLPYFRWTYGSNLPVVCLTGFVAC